MYQIQGISMSSAFSLASSLNFTCVTPRAPRLLRPSKALNSTPIPFPFPTPHRPKYSIGAKLKPLGGFAVAALLINNKDKRIGVAFASADSKPMAVQKSENEWRALLSPQQFRILRQKATELPGTGEYNKFYGDGTYKCAGCGTPLYKSTSKFDSGCGWPAFFEGLPGAIKRTPDADGRRIEITCAACGGHLGHVFKGEGFPTPTDERHCVNSISMKFTPANE